MIAFHGSATEEVVHFEEPEETWAIVELMGRQVVSGRVSADTKFNSGLLRIEIPVGGSLVTQFVNPSVAIFRMTLCSETEARAKHAEPPPSPA